MNKIYTRTNWENYPSEATALNETNLNKVDLAVDELDNRIIHQDTVKLSKTDATDDIVDWDINETTGVITITRRSGEQILFDLNIEKIPVDFKLSEDGILTMTTDDGTEFTANIGAMIPVLTFNDSDEISVSVSGTGINKTYSFSIKTGSVTEDKLQPNFLADIKVESANALASANNASISATNSANSAIESESFAVGGTGTRTGEDTDNAKYYNEQAQEALSKMQSAQVTGVKGNNETEYRKGEVNLTAENIGAVEIGGDVAENTVAFTSNDSGPDGTPALISLEKLTTGEKLSALMNKVSIIANNFRYFLKMLGNNDISSIGDGTVTGGISALNDNFAKYTKKLNKLWASSSIITTTLSSGGLALLIGNNCMHILFSSGGSISVNTVYQKNDIFTFNISKMSMVVNVENGSKSLWAILPIMGEWTLK